MWSIASSSISPAPSQKAASMSMSVLMLQSYFVWNVHASLAVHRWWMNTMCQIQIYRWSGWMSECRNPNMYHNILSNLIMNSLVSVIPAYRHSHGIFRILQTSKWKIGNAEWVRSPFLLDKPWEVFVMTRTVGTWNSRGNYKAWRAGIIISSWSVLFSFVFQCSTPSTTRTTMSSWGHRRAVERPSALSLLFYEPSLSLMRVVSMSHLCSVLLIL